MADSALPVALKRVIDAGELSRTDPCDATTALGSFWPNSRTSFESHLVKGFKECHPVASFEPHISALCEFYATCIIRAAGDDGFGCVVRVLSSSEKEPDASRPQTLLASALCRRIGAHDTTDMFFKSEARPPMRAVPRLSGPDALEARIKYVLQDLFIKPRKIGGRFLLIDDICNVGASALVYAQALKQFAEAASVVSINLAATRFHEGKDGRGMLKLDVSGLQGAPGLRQIWMDTEGIFHETADCPELKQSAGCSVRFVAERKAKPCPLCLKPGSPERKWWRLW